MGHTLPLLERFQGCLLGVALGDALGRRFEGISPEEVARSHANPEALVAARSTAELYYTDDTQMTLGVAETLVENFAILEDRLCHHFVRNYVPSRGYGFGARRVLEAMENGEDHRTVAETFYPGGSFGNGAAMRVAPVGLFFHDDLDRTWEQARRSALPTHTHPLGIEGAQLLAVGVALALREDPFDRVGFFSELIARCQCDEYRASLNRASTAGSLEEIAVLGNAITALESVPTALASFATSPDDYVQAVGRVVFLGGDTDTIAAMTGALVGARVGIHALPAGLLDALEDGEKGRSYLLKMGEQLHHSFKARTAR